MALLDLNWSPAPRVYRVFGLSTVVVGLLVALLGASVHLRLAAPVLLACGLWCVVMPARLTRPVYLVFLLPSWLIGQVVSHVLVALFYFLVVTPIGAILRLSGHDPLVLRGHKPSYWHEIRDARDPADYEGYF